MSSRVDVSNRALSMLGEDYKLTDPADDVKPARAIAACWDMCRRRVLRSNPWNFALERFVLQQAIISTDKIWPFTAAYPLPPESLRFHEILSPQWLDPESWQNEDGRILMRYHSGPIRVRCVVDRPAVEDWDETACEALAADIAFQIADEVTGDQNRKTSARADSKAAISEAKGIDAIENPPIIPDEDDEWIMARFR